MGKTSLTLAIIGMIGFNNAIAHDVWLEHKNSDYELVYGHVGELETLEPEKVRVIRGYSACGQEMAISTTSSEESMQVKPASNPGMITVDYDNGFWSKIGPSEWENRSKRHYPDYFEASHSLKFNKNIMAWHDSFSNPVGQRLEITPMESTVKASKDNQIPLLVLHQGEPLAGAVVEVHGFDDSFKTNGQGYVSVPVNKDNSLQYIAAYHRYKMPGHLDADEISLTANLVFHRQ